MVGATKSVLEAADLTAGDPPELPVSFTLQRGEILSLLFPQDRPRAPLLRVLAGKAQPRSGVLHYPGTRPRVAIAVGGWPSAFKPNADLVLIDGLMAGATGPETWMQFASECKRGTSIVVATSCEEQAYRSDRVSLAMWTPEEAMRAAKRVREDLHAMIVEFLRLTKRGRETPSAALVAQLRRLNRAARDLIAEARRNARDLGQIRSAQRIASDFEAHSVDMRIFDAAIAQAQDCEPDGRDVTRDRTKVKVGAS